MFWPNAKRVAVEQQNHPSWKGKAAPTNWHQPRIASIKINNDTALHKIKQCLSSNFYSCLSPPPCQVKEHKPECCVTSSDTSKVSKQDGRKIEKQIGMMARKGNFSQHSEGLDSPSIKAVNNWCRWQGTTPMNNGRNNPIHDCWQRCCIWSRNQGLLNLLYKRTK
jgi:hypothetical protein